MGLLSRVISSKNNSDFETCYFPKFETENNKNVQFVTSKQIDNAQREAYDEGVSLGRKDAYNRFSGQLQTIVGSISDTLGDFDEKTLQEIATLIITCSRQLIRHELNINPELMISVTREAIALLPLADREINILMHPEDCAVVRDAFESDDKKLAVNIMQDPLMSRGSCIVMSEDSRIDATIESRLEAVVKQMLEDDCKIDEL